MMEVVKSIPLAWWVFGVPAAFLLYKLVKLVRILRGMLKMPIGQPPYARLRNPPTPPKVPEVLIIGAGPAGVGAAGALKHEGIESLIIERNENFASAWRNHYKRLHLHTAGPYSHLPHIPYPPHYPLYPSRQQVVDYITGYAHMMQVQAHFNETVVSVDREGAENKWVVQTEQKDGTKATYTPKIVVIATGENTVPALPKVKDQELFKGVLIHSTQYKTAEDFRGKKVLVVGFGNTGGELTIDLYEHGCDVSVVIRSALNIVRREKKLVVAPCVRFLPPVVQQTLEWISRQTDYRDLAKYGITSPKPGWENLVYFRLRKYHESAVTDIGQIDLIRQKHVKVITSEVARFTRNGVVFQDGREEEFDVVVYATGFTSNLDNFLPKSILEKTINDLGFPKGTAKPFPEVSGLYYIGYADEAGRILKISEDAVTLAGLVKKEVSAL